MGLLDDWMRAKKQQKARAAGGNPGAPAGDPRIPPGQVETKKWPVLHTGEVPKADLATWDIRIFGEVDASFRLIDRTSLDHYIRGRTDGAFGLDPS